MSSTKPARASTKPAVNRQKSNLTDKKGKRSGDEIEITKSLSRSTSFKPPTKEEMFDSFLEELQESPQHLHLSTRDSDALSSVGDAIAYQMENAIAADSNVRFYVLFAISGIVCALMALFWRVCAERYSLYGDTAESYASSMFMTFQVLTTGGYSQINHLGPRVVFFFMIASGVTLVSILIGLITDSVNVYMESLSSGSSKVVEEGHTLILGWNEATVRVICQIAFLRKVYQAQNLTFTRKWLRLNRVRPSSPVVHHTIVVMNNTMPKEDMEQIVLDSFGARNVDTKSTKLGRDVVFRKGDPMNQHDLVRAAAHKATSIMIMMNAIDSQDADSSHGHVQNNSTLHTILALRNVIYSSVGHDNGSSSSSSSNSEHFSSTTSTAAAAAASSAFGFNPDLRVVVQLSSACPFLPAASFMAPQGHNVLFAQDLNKFINTHMFVCATKPGLSRVLLEMLNFQGTAMRTRRPKELRGGPQQKLGWFVGKSMKEAMLNHGWANSVLIGCDDSHLNCPHDNSVFKDCPGMVADPSRLIQPDDFLIFVSKTSNPQPSFAAADRKNFEEEAAPFVKDARRRATTVDPSQFEPKHVLIVGWRQLWENDPTRFKARVSEMVAGFPSGSTVTTLNIKTSEAMNDYCKALGFKPARLRYPKSSSNSSLVTSSGASNDVEEEEEVVLDGFQIGGKEPGGNVTLVHYEGDAVNLDILRTLMKRTAFHTAVVFGTIYGVDLSPTCQDGRSLQLLLGLRQVCIELGQTMHVIAENERDQTSTLALGPQHGEETPAPDFINTQGLVARILVFNLAFPQVWDSVSELVSVAPNTPEIDLLHPNRLGLLGKTLSFGALQHVVNKAYAGCAVAIGIVKGRELLLSPSLGSKEKFNAKTRIVLIMRNNGNSATIKGEEHSEEDVVKVKKVEVVDLDEKEGSFKVVMGSDI